MERTSKGWGSGLVGVIVFSGSLPATRVAIEGLRTGLPHLGPRRDRGRAGRGPAAGAEAEAAGPGRPRPAGGGGPGRRGRLSAADGPGAAAHRRGPFDRLHRPAAPGDGGVRRVARGRAPQARVLGVLDRRGPVGRGLRRLARRLGLAGRRPADGGGDHRLRPGLRRGRGAVAPAGRLAGDLLGPGVWPCR